MYVVLSNDGQVILVVCFELMNCCNRMNSSNRESKESENEENQVAVEQRVRIEREYRICPSKLSKREIEDLYYKLLQENIELKKKLNHQEDRIRLMSVAMRRMTRDNTERKKAPFSIEKDKKRNCCSGTKTVINKQKESIFELRKENEQLAERIKQLNMKLCSAKQFLNRRPSVQSRCAKCAVRPSTSGSRNLSSSTLPTKGSEVTVKNKSVSYHQQHPQELSKDEEAKPTEKTESPETGDVAAKQGDADEGAMKSCEENRCRTLMDELRQKIGTLEDELARTHEEYSERITRLEREVVELQRLNVRVRSDSAARARALQQREQAAHAQCGDLALQLSIEKSKVAELETQMKAANMSNQIAKAIEGQMVKKIASPASLAVAVSSITTDQLKVSSPPPSSKRNSMRAEQKVEQAKGAAKSTIVVPLKEEEGIEKGDTDTEKTPLTSNSKVICECNVPDKKSKVKCECPTENMETCAKDNTEPCLTCYPIPDKVPNQTERRSSRRLSKEIVEKRRKSMEKSSKVICECNRIAKKSKSKVKCECRVEKELKLMEPGTSRDAKDPCTECCYTGSPQNAVPLEFVTPQILKGPEIAGSNVRKSITPESSLKTSADDHGAQSSKTLNIPHDQARSAGTIGPQILNQTGPKISIESEHAMNSKHVNEATSPRHSFDNRNFKTITPTIYASRKDPSNSHIRISNPPVYQAKTVPLNEQIQSVDVNDTVQLRDTMTPSSDPANVTVPDYIPQNDNFTSIAIGSIGETVPIKRVEEIAAITVHELYLTTDSTDQNALAPTADDPANASDRRKSSTATPVGTIVIAGTVDSFGRFSASPRIISEQLTSNGPEASEEIRYKLTPETAEMLPADVHEVEYITEPTKRKVSTPKSGTVTGPTDMRSSQIPLTGSTPEHSEEIGSSRPRSTEQRTSSPTTATSVTEESGLAKSQYNRRQISAIKKADGARPIVSGETASMPGPTDRRLSINYEKAGSSVLQSTGRRISIPGPTTSTEESGSTKPGFSRKRISATSKAGSLPAITGETKSVPGTKRSSKLLPNRQSNTPMPEVTGRSSRPPMSSGRLSETTPRAAGEISGKPLNDDQINDTVPTGTSPRNDTVPMGTGQIKDTVPMGTGQINYTVPMGTGQINDTVPMSTGQIKDTVPMGIGQINDNVPTSPAQINAAVPSGIKQTDNTDALAANPLSDIPVTTGKTGNSVSKDPDQTNASPLDKTILPPSGGNASSSLPTSSAEDIEISEAKLKRHSRGSVQLAQWNKKKADSLLLMDADRPKSILSGLFTTTPKVTDQEDLLEESNSKNKDKRSVSIEQGIIQICDTCGKPVDVEEKRPSQIHAKLSVQLPPYVEIERSLKENVEGQQQSETIAADSPCRGQKPLDDSGFVEQRNPFENDSLLNNEEEQERLNKELLEKIASLQEQLDSLKVAAAGETPPRSPPKSPPAPSELELPSEAEQDHTKENYDDIVKNMTKMDRVMKKQEALLPGGRHEGRGKLDEANRRWVDYDLGSEDNLTDKASITPFENRGPGRDSREDREDGPSPSDNKYQIPGPIPTTSTPVEKRKDATRRNSREMSRPKRPGGRSSSSFEHRESIQIGDPKKRRESKEKSRQEALTTIPILDQHKTDDAYREDLDKAAIYEIKPANARDVGIQTYDQNSEFIPADFSVHPQNNPIGTEKETAEEQKEEVQLAMCEACTQVCRCRTSAKVDSVLLRSCSGSLRVLATSGPNVKFKRCISCSGGRVSGTIKVACPFNPPHSEQEATRQNDPTIEKSYPDQTALPLQRGSFQIVEHPDGCLNAHTQRICLELLARPETIDPASNAKRKCGCSNEKTCQSAICRPKRDTRISLGTQGYENDIGTYRNDTGIGTQTDEKLNRIINSKYSKSTDDETETDFSSSAERRYHKESPTVWVHRDSPPLSPGERRRTLNSDAAYNTLSEGELPADSPRGHTKLVGDKQTETTYSLDTPTPSQKMAEMLQAISAELTRCRQLLQTKRPSQHTSPKTCDVASSAADKPSQISLHKADAKPRLGDAVTPKCIFTLHIGTVVLSDEAVINSADAALSLTWQFYDQNVATTRMRAGRVVHFDFSTEYDVKLTDDFLEYLKHDEMPILICDVNRNDETFASCSLPLRDALLHTNRRADMSLALVAGPRLRRSRAAAADALDAGDEIGVVDLWCMLRAEPRFLPLINRAIAKNTTVKQESSNSSGARGARSGSAIMPQLDENDPDECQLSVDLDFTGRGARGAAIKRADIEALKAEHANLSTLGKQEFKPPVAAPVRRTSLPRSMSWMSHDRDGRDDYSSSRADIGRKNEMENSGIIVNKVPTNIRSTMEMQKALEKSTINVEPPKKNSELVHTPSMLSIGSRSFWKRKMSPPKQRLSLSQDLDYNTTANIQDLLNNRLQGISRIADATQTPHTIQTAIEVSETGFDVKKAIDAFRRVKIRHQAPRSATTNEFEKEVSRDRLQDQVIDITVQWLALNEECEAMSNAEVQRLYVAYSFLGKNGAELETPISLPKPKQYSEKCTFDFRKSFQLSDHELQALGRLARCRAPNKGPHNRRECVVFTVVSEPAEDPLAIHNCEDVGYAYLYFGDILAYSAGSDTYTEVLPIHGAEGGNVVCGVLAIKVDGLDVVRKSLLT